MSEKITLFLIDCQNDFCDPNGSLYVHGAITDCVRLSNLIYRFGEKIKYIYATMDWHRYFSVFHNIFWKTGKEAISSDKDKIVEPYTIIPHEDIKKGIYIPVKEWLKNDALAYAEALKNKGSDPLTAWPVHCLQGTWGSNIFPGLTQAFQKWQQEAKKSVCYFLKGESSFTEHYGAFVAEVVDSLDPRTQYKKVLRSALALADTILVGGEAGSHCVSKTIKQFVEYNFSDGGDGGDLIKKIVWLEDAISPVPGFEEKQEKFVENMKAKGMRVAKTSDF